MPDSTADSAANDENVDQRPQVGVGAVVFRDERVLLVLRGQAPNAGQWAIPGGRVRWGETLQAGAEREILEETGVRIRAGEPVFAFEVIEDEDGACATHYVVVDLAAQYLEGEPRAGDDAAEARWVSAAELAALPVNETTRRLLRSRYDFG
ncbi:MAG: NUDIX hydrolase [Gammaproteobacteria bacterium]